MAEKPGKPNRIVGSFSLSATGEARAEEKALQLAVTCIRQRSSGMTALTPWICFIYFGGLGQFGVENMQGVFLGWWFLGEVLLGY